MNYVLKWFDIKDTFECGQVFRYTKLEDNIYRIISKDKVATLTQQNDSVDIDTDSIEYFEKYFDTCNDYDSVINTLLQFEEMYNSINSCKGIRILKQDLLETIVSFIISANNNIGRIKGTLNALSKVHGDVLSTQEQLYAFPSIEQLSNVTLDNWVEYGAGYRAPQLIETINNIHNNKIIETINYWYNNLDYTKKKTQIYQLLLAQKGIGPKVADCIMLFALGFSDSFPVDTWIFNSLKSKTLDTKDKVREYYSNRYGALCGYAQQYIFYYNRSKKSNLN